MLFTIKEVERLKNHAIAHYAEDGWDILVECWTDEDVAEELAKHNSYEEAVIAISAVLSIIADVREDTQNA